MNRGKHLVFDNVKINVIYGVGINNSFLEKLMKPINDTGVLSSLLVLAYEYNAN